MKQGIITFLSSVALAALMHPDASGQQGNGIREVREINPTTAEVVFSDGKICTVDFYGENIFRVFQDNSGGIVRDPQADPPARILANNPRRDPGKVSASMEQGCAVIRAIVFDMGNVLLRFQPQLVSRLCTENEADAQQLYAGLFQRPEWAMTDSGALSDPEFLERVIPGLPPHLQEAGRRAFACWDQYLPPVPGMEELLRGLKAAGYRLYVCSNASRRFFSYTTPLPMFSLFDGILVSAVERCVKPDPAIYQRLFERLFKWKLAYADEPYPMTLRGPDGTVEYAHFDRYEFLKRDAAGQLYWNDEFLFDVDPASNLASNRENLWTMIDQKYQAGAFGPLGEPASLYRLWTLLAETGYPHAETMKTSIGQQMEREAARQAAAPAQEGGTPL